MSAPQLRVLSVVWNLIRGGTEGQCARTAIAHTAMGAVHRVALFRREGFFLDAVETACGPIVDFGIRKMASLDTLHRIRTLANFIRHERIQVLHAWDVDASLFATRAARCANIPFITSRRDLAQIYPPHKLWLMARADRKAARLVINAEAIRPIAQAARVNHTHIRTIPNILDLAEFDRLSTSPLPYSLPGAPLIVIVSRLDPEKDIATFLRAISLARRSVPTLQAVIAGDGVERGSLQALAAKLQITRNLTFLGDVKEVPALLSRCTIGVLSPRSNEGLSNTILEYMAAGLPVVATDCGGNREIVSHEQNGFIVPIGDSDTLAKYLLHLLAHPDLAQTLGRHGRDIVRQRHAPERITAQFDALYREVIGHG